MNNKQYIQIAEMSEDEESLTKKWISMKFLEKFVLKIFTPKIEQMSTSFNQSIQNLHSENKQLKEQLNELLEKYRILSEQVQKDSQKTATLLADYNTKKASSDAKYRTVINVLYSLNLKFSQNVSTFGKAKKLELLEMLVKYLYHPSDNLRETILSLSEDNDKSASILCDIDNFNNNYREDLVNYLSEINTTWEDCVQFPSNNIFNSQIMTPFNDDIEEGAPVYIVTLGYAFPNSNSERQLPNVFKR